MESKLNVYMILGQRVVLFKRVKESDLTGKESTITLIDGTVRRLIPPNLMLDGKFVNGEIEALVMENPVKPIIIGRVRGVKYIVGKDEEEGTNDATEGSDHNAEVKGDASDRRDPII